MKIVSNRPLFIDFDTFYYTVIRNILNNYFIQTRPNHTDLKDFKQQKRAVCMQIL